MNIIYVGDCGPKPSGAPISCDQLTRAFARHGWRVRVLAPELAAGDRELNAFDAARPEIEAHHYPVPAYFFHPFERPPAEWEEATKTGVGTGLEQLIAQSRPDAILIRELWLPYANGAARRHAIPSVAMVRGNPTSAMLEGVFPADLAERFLAALRSADRIVTVARHFLPGLGGLGLANVTCIPNAVDTAAFAPRPPDKALTERLGIGDSDIVVLHASQIRPIKRPLDIVQAAQEVLRRNHHVLYLIVGDGVSRDEMRALTEEYAIGERFRFEPFVDNSLMPSYMSVANLVIMPSEREGLSRVYLEAQACAKTLLASDIAGAREVITHGETGLLFRKGDVADQAEQTLLAAGDPALRARIGRQARQYVERHHDVDDAVAQYMALLQLQCGREGHDYPGTDCL